MGILRGKIYHASQRGPHCVGRRHGGGGEEQRTSGGGGVRGGHRVCVGSRGVGGCELDINLYNYIRC